MPSNEQTRVKALHSPAGPGRGGAPGRPGRAAAPPGHCPKTGPGLPDGNAPARNLTFPESYLEIGQTDLSDASVLADEDRPLPGEPLDLGPRWGIWLERVGQPGPAGRGCPGLQQGDVGEDGALGTRSTPDQAAAYHVCSGVQTLAGVTQLPSSAQQPQKSSHPLRQGIQGCPRSLPFPVATGGTHLW